jgi:hypothetical protein
VEERRKNDEGGNYRRSRDSQNRLRLKNIYIKLIENWEGWKYKLMSY